MSIKDAFYFGFGSKECHDWMSNGIRVSSKDIESARKMLFDGGGHLPNFGMQDRDLYLFNGGLAMTSRNRDNELLPEVAIYHNLENGLRDMAIALKFEIPENYEIKR